MDTIQIIRIEHPKDGKGLFQSKAISTFDDKNLFSELNEMMIRHIDFPTPRMDNLDRHQCGWEWFCAFLSVEQFQKWVTKSEMQYLVSLGFQVLLLTVCDYQRGCFQVLYTKESIIKSETITNLFI